MYRLLVCSLFCLLAVAATQWTLDYPEAKQDPANDANYQKGRQEKIKGVVLHGTAGPNAVQYFKKPEAQVSAHYVIEQDGSVIQMVSEDDTAWHAGVVSPNSEFANGPNPNSWLIGIEFSRDTENANHMPEVQVEAGLKLVKDMKRRYGAAFGVYTHDQFDTTRVCPGPKFPVDRFKEAVNGRKRHRYFVRRRSFNKNF
jgi:N-acetyl-anhydromuramyl-L-alanine amidase AmpD